MKNKITQVWTVVYKEKNGEPKAYSYLGERSAMEAKKMVDESNGTSVFNEQEEFQEVIEIEWSYVIQGKLITPK